MAAGDVDVQIVDADATAIDTAVTAMRTTANDKWLMCSTANGMQVIIVNIEEA
jgi:hypothetical protein